MKSKSTNKEKNVSLHIIFMQSKETERNELNLNFQEQIFYYDKKARRNLSLETIHFKESKCYCC